MICCPIIIFISSNFYLAPSRCYSWRISFLTQPSTGINRSPIMRRAMRLSNGTPCIWLSKSGNTNCLNLGEERLEKVES